MDLAFGMSPSDFQPSVVHASRTKVAACWRDVHVSAAAQWIIYSAQNTFQQVMNPSETLEYGVRQLRIPLAEWRRWKEGSKDESTDTERQDEALGLARRAASLMESLEGNMTPVLVVTEIRGSRRTAEVLARLMARKIDQPKR